MDHSAPMARRSITAERLSSSTVAEGDAAAPPARDALTAWSARWGGTHARAKAEPGAARVMPRVHSTPAWGRPPGRTCLVRMMVSRYSIHDCMSLSLSAHMTYVRPRVVDRSKQ